MGLPLHQNWAADGHSRLSPYRPRQTRNMGNNKVGDLNGALQSQTCISNKDVENDTQQDGQEDVSGNSQKSKLMVVFVAPVIFMLAMALAQMSINIQFRDEVLQNKRTLDFFVGVEQLISILEDQRSLAVSYFVSNKTNLDAYGELYVYQKIAEPVYDEVMQMIEETYPWYDLTNIIDSWDSLVDCDLQTCDLSTNNASILFDTMIGELVTLRDGQVDVPQASAEFPMWSRYTSVAALARVIDNLSQQEASVCIVLTNCYVTTTLHQEFESMNGQKDILLRMVGNYYPPSLTALNETADPMNILFTNDQDVAYGEFFDPLACNLQEDNSRFFSIAVTRSYFQHVITVARVIQNDVIISIMSDLDAMMQSLSNTIVAYSVTLTVLTLSCLAISVWYSSIIQTMISNMQDIAANIGRKTEELESEKKRSEYLLMQMLPESVVLKLGRGEQVLPELYPEVTIFFSDIVAFEEISTRSDPHQIVEMLNQLYM